MKIARHTIKQLAETKISETLDLKGLKIMFPYDWQKKKEELKNSRFTSVIYPK